MSEEEQKSSYSNDVKQATVRLIEASPEWAELQAGKRLRLSTDLMSQARTVSGGATPQSIRNWLKTDISKEEEDERLHHRGRKSIHSPEFLKLAVGHAVERRLGLAPVSSQDIIDWARGFLNKILRQQFVSELLTSHGLSSQRTLARNSRMVDLNVADQSVEFVLEQRRWRKEFPGLMVMDETGLWSNTIPNQTYHFIGQCVISFLC